MPLGKTFWSPRFGMVKDRFGVGWMIDVIMSIMWWRRVDRRRETPCPTCC